VAALFLLSQTPNIRGPKMGGSREATSQKLFESDRKIWKHEIIFGK
jgi:hypothetical protein